MMASHRPSDPPPDEPVAPPPAPTPAAAGGGLQPSGFVVGFDWVLAFGVLVLAFFVGSFSARNADLWMHLAAGRLLADGGYSFGTDPFSYAAGGRTWVNHEWLYDWGLYQFFKAGEGQAIVIAKCLTLVLTAGLLLFVRRPGQSAFPVVVCTGLALVAAAPRFALQPQVASVLLLAGFLCALARMPKRAGSWAFPAVVGGLFGVWANVDQWFFIGPAFLALYAVGQFVRRDPDTDPMTVLKALGIGVVACCLNPHHVNVWEIPGELAGGRLEKIFQDDPEFAPLFRGGFDKTVWDFEANPANPAALLGLLALSAAGFALNFRHLSVGLALVWAGAAGLAAWHLRALPFFAVAAAPVAALNLARAAARLAARPLPDGTVRALQTGQTTGRFAVGLVGLLLIAVSYAGWLHPFTSQRRWKWDVEPVVSNQRAAEQIHAWRTTGALPGEARILNLQPDLASYIAWFAPGQQTFFDYRLGLLAPEAEDYAAVRRRLAARNPVEVKQDEFDFTAFLRKYKVVYAVTAHPNRNRNQYALSVLWSAGEDSDWVLWQVTGRAVLLGWRGPKDQRVEPYPALRFSPPGTAFVNPAPVPEPATPLRAAVRAEDVWDRFVASPPISPADGEEVLVLERYRESRMGQLIARHRALLEAPSRLLNRLYLPRPEDRIGGRKYYWLSTAYQSFMNAAVQMLPVESPVEVTAVSLLAVRAGRRAVVASPDHPDGYFLLARAYQEPSYLTFPDLRTVVTSANLARCLVRLPTDPAKKGVTIDVQEACQRLFAAHMEATPPRRDLGLECRRVAATYLRHDTEELDAAVGRIEDDTVRKRAELEVTAGRQMLEQLQKGIDQDEKNLRGASDTYVNVVATLTSPLDRAAVARQLGLVNVAITELEKGHQAYAKQMENEVERDRLTTTDQALNVAIHTELIELLMYAGRVEEAVEILDALDTDENMIVLGRPKVREEHYNVRRQAFRRLFPDPRRAPESPYDGDPAAQVRSLRQVVSLAVGQYGGTLQAQEADAVGVRAALDQFVRLNFPAGAPPLEDVARVDFPREFARLALLQLGVLRVPIDPGVAALAQAGLMIRFYATRGLQQYGTLVQGRADAHTRLALTYLEMGNIDKAVHHFTQAVEGIETPYPSPTERIARTYLKAIAQAVGPGK